LCPAQLDAGRDHGVHDFSLFDLSAERLSERGQRFRRFHLKVIFSVGHSEDKLSCSTGLPLWRDDREVCAQG